MTVTHRGGRPRLLYAVLLALAAALWAVPAASAHSVLLSISPPDGATVPTAPAQVVVTFNEDVNTTFSVIQVTDAGGRDVNSGHTVVSGPKVIQALRANLPGGTYRIAYKVISSDGHPVSGVSTFVVGSPSTPSPSTSSPPSTPGGPTGASGASGTGTPAPSGSGGAGAPLWPWLLVGGAVVVLGGAAGYRAARRRGTRPPG